MSIKTARKIRPLAHLALNPKAVTRVLDTEPVNVKREFNTVGTV